MKKKLGYIAMITLAVTLCACGKQSKKTANEYGLEVVALMDEMTKSESYSKLMSNPDEIKELGKKIGEGDYSTPEAVYEISSLTDLDALLDVYGDEETAKSLEGVSAELKELLNQKTTTLFVTQTNARAGVSYLAASSVYSAEKLFVCDELKENVIYIYTYKTGYPIAVCFKVGENHAVDAVGSFLLDSNFETDSADSIEKMLKEDYNAVGCKVKKIQ